MIYPPTYFFADKHEVILLCRNISHNTFQRYRLSTLLIRFAAALASTMKTVTSPITPTTYFLRVRSTVWMDPPSTTALS